MLLPCGLFGGVYLTATHIEDGNVRFVRLDLQDETFDCVGLGFTVLPVHLLPGHQTRLHDPRFASISLLRSIIPTLQHLVLTALLLQINLLEASTLLLLGYILETAYFGGLSHTLPLLLLLILPQFG